MMAMSVIPEDYSFREYDRVNRFQALQKPFTITTQSGKNVGKVRWLQDTSSLDPDPSAEEYFISTSCGESLSDIGLWRVCSYQDEFGQLAGKVDSVDKIESTSTVTDAVGLNEEVFAVSTMQGALVMYKCPRDKDGALNRVEFVTGKNLHHSKGAISCPARAVATNGTAIVSVGEDGSIYESLISTSEVTRSLVNADPLSMCCVDYIGRSEVISGNSGGQLKLWDLKSPNSKPMLTMNPNVAMNTVYGCSGIGVHPSQRHFVIAAYQSGCMDLFDMRLGSGCEPIANLVSDGGILSELYFHGLNPDHFFSCSQSGQVCHWYPGSECVDMEETYSQETNIEFLKQGLVFKQIYSSRFPVNSLNLSKNDRLVCGGDNGVVFVQFDICINN